MRQYIGFLGSDRFEVSAKHNQGAALETARAFISKYKLRVKPSWLDRYAHTFQVPTNGLDSEDLVNLCHRMEKNGTI
jgi:hypothetical protein